MSDSLIHTSLMSARAPLARRAAQLLFFLLVCVAGTSAQQVPAAKAAAPTRDHVIRAGDVLRLRVWPEEALSGEYPVVVSGVVYLPQVGELQVAGLPQSEVQRRIRELYAQAMKNPLVSTTPVFPVAVTGEVPAPGIFPTEPTHNVMDVIARAGGFTARAKINQIRIVRDGAALTFNASEVLERGKESTVTLQSGDWIVVPARGGISWQSVLTGLQLVTSLTLITTQLAR